jgi:zinc protease
MRHLLVRSLARLLLNMSNFLLLLSALLAAGFGAFAGPVIDTTFSNGMRVVVEEDHRSPEVVVQVWYKVGSIDENEGLTGVAHVLEHLMFAGTTAYPGDFAERIASAGGHVNAFTSYHYTAYSEQLPKGELDLALRLEADRMHNLRISDGPFAKARNAAIAERKWRIEDNTQALVRERLIAAAFPDAPAGHPVIGWRKDLERMKAADAQTWYTRWYAPNAAVLVIVGDVNAPTALDQAREHFNPLTPTDLAPRDLRLTGIAGHRARIVITPSAGATPYLAMVYPVPGLRHAQREWEPYALQVLAAVLQMPSAPGFTGAKDSASDPDAVRVWYDMLRAGPSVFLIDGTPTVGTTLADLEAEMRRRMDAARRDVISTDILDRVKVRLSKTEAERTQSIFEQARRIGLMETMGLSFRDRQTLVDKIKDVDSTQVRDVARHYLADTRATIAELRP